MSYHLEPALDGVRLFSSPSYEHPRQDRGPAHRRDSAGASVPKIDPAHPALRGSLTPPSDCGASKVLNFSPGPTNLPPAVEAAVRARCLPEARELRLGSMALSHRSPEFGAILRRALETTRRVMEVPPEYDILFTQGGGHGQFAAVPMNLCPTGAEAASYVVNGTWSKRAVEEASKYCRPHVISSLESDGSCTAYPSLERLNAEVDPDSAFLYVCSNETVNGLELHRLPRLDCDVPLVVDASSDFTSKPIAWRECNVGVLFACASKNIGHPGITMVVVRRDLLGRANPFTPGFLNYRTNILADNVWNTIPTFNVDVIGIMMEWIEEEGGMAEMERRSVAKAELVYATIDGSGGFFGTPVEKESGCRSRMNAPFCVADGDEDLTNLFLVECWERGIVGLRTVTPFKQGKYLRASLYHGVSEEEAVVLTDFMKEFAARHTISKEASLTPVASHAALATIPGSPAGSEQSLDSLDLPFPMTMGKNNKQLFAKLGSSPDTVTDTSFTLPKNFKFDHQKPYARVTADMFAPPPPVLR
ncbi:hypothetical protein ACHAXT_009571 [Thalassiosira profunda]